MSDENVSLARPTDFNGRRIPPKATHYQITRDGNDSVKLTFGERDGIVAFEWPLAELDAETIRARFGAGDYCLTWVTRENGKVRVSPPQRAQRFTIAPLPRAEAPAPVAAMAPTASFACCGSAWPKFCGMCGKSAGAPAAAMAAMVAPDFMQGMTFALQMHREAGELARADAARLIAREEQEHELRVKRLDHQYAVELRAQEERYKHAAAVASTAGVQSAAPDGAVVAALAQLSDRMSELDDKIDDAADDAAEKVDEVKSGIGSLVSTFKTLEPVLLPLAQAAIQKWSTPAAAPAASNGAAGKH